MNSDLSNSRTADMRRAMTLANRESGTDKPAKKWAKEYGVSISHAYNIAREVGLQFIRHLNKKFPPEICVTYGRAKFHPRPCVCLPTTAIRAAGLDGQRKLKITVSEKQIVLGLTDTSL